MKKTPAELAKGKVLGGKNALLLILAFPCFRCARLSGWCIELLGVLHGIPREFVGLLVEFVIG
jgi:hypothetical protein